MIPEKMMMKVTNVDVAHNAHNMCIVKNITLRIDDARLDHARRIAAERSTSVNALIREFIDDLVAQESRAEKARREILDLCKESSAVIGEYNLDRESLYDR